METQAAAAGTVSEPVTRPEFDNLRSRLDTIDAGGTRGVAVVAVQLQDLAKDVARLEKDMQAHRQDHAAAEHQRIVSRRWAVMAVLSAITAVDVPTVLLLLLRR